MKKYQFITLTDEKFPIRNTFMEAWEDMYQYVKNGLDENILNLQLVETAIWIEQREGKLVQPIHFYNARDLAIEKYGWKKSTCFL